ncbi:MAG: tRNA dihydrouridine synthase DusB [Lachnospiraceae bacterium]|jgi:tRNA-dihydrouridine synthase B|nr:tRNA dihydrouridine synthase DusB [Lachnospiraceae bacterium]
MNEPVFTVPSGPFRIGSVTVPNRLVLAPMAGVSDLPFRTLCRAQGAGLVCTEMISAKAICYGNRATGELMRTLPGETPLSLQLFTHEPEVIARALDIIADRPFDILDINMGCPMPKIVNNGEGSRLMQDPPLIQKIVQSAVAHTARPVTVKLRTGWDAAHVNAVECALAAEAGGASAVTVHGRTRAQMYAGEADLATIAAVKRALKIPVIGNGNVRDGASAREMFCKTGCDAVMIARAAEGDPWIFARIARALNGEEEGTRPGPGEVRKMILAHAGLQRTILPEGVAMREMRKHVTWYITGFEGASRIRSEVNEVESFEELQELLDSCLKAD